MTTTTTAPPALSRSRELRLLRECLATPRERAELHGLELRAYLEAVYGYDPGPPAGGVAIAAVAAGEQP